METYKSNKTRNIITCIFLAIFFIFGGLGKVFVTDDIVIGILCISCGGYALFCLFRLIINPKSQSNINKGPFAYPEKQDIKIVNLLKKNPILGLPYLLSIVLIVLFLFIEFENYFVLRFLDFIKISSFGALLHIVVWFFVLSFICFSFYILGYLLLGEILQRKLSVSKKNIFIDLIVNFIYAIPFIIILSFLWAIFIFVKDKENRNMPTSIASAIKSFSLYALLIMFKYYTYINLAIIVFGDRKRCSLRDSFIFFKKERIQLLSIYFKSGFIFGAIFLFMSILALWNEKFHIIDETIPWAISGISFILFFLFGLLSEQISFLFYFIKIKHQECDLNKLL